MVNQIIDLIGDADFDLAAVMASIDEAGQGRRAPELSDMRDIVVDAHTKLNNAIVALKNVRDFVVHTDISDDIDALVARVFAARPLWIQADDDIHNMTCFFDGDAQACNGHVYYDGSVPSTPWAASVPDPGDVDRFETREEAMAFVEAKFDGV